MLAIGKMVLEKEHCGRYPSAVPTFFSIIWAKPLLSYMVVTTLIRLECKGMAKDTLQRKAVMNKTPLE